MDETRIERFLRAGPPFRDAVPPRALALPAEIPGSAGRLDRRLLLMATAAVLLATVAFGLAVGAGWIRLPQPPDRSRPLFGAVCDNDLLPDGVVATVESSAGLFTLDGDGWFVSGPPVPNVDPGHEGLSGRRMSPEGVDRYLETVEHADIPFCGEATSEQQGIDGQLVALTPSGLVSASVDTVPYVSAIRVLNPAEAEAWLAALTQLSHPEEWLPDSAWLIPTIQPFEPVRYALGVQFRDPLASETFRLPNGSTLADFGVVMRDGGTHGCADLTQAQAIALREQLNVANPGRGGNDNGSGMWDFYGSSRDYPDATIWVSERLPSGQSCAGLLASTTAPSPTPTPAVPPRRLDPCIVVTPGDLQAATGHGFRIGQPSQAEQAPIQGSVCIFVADTGNYWDDVSVHAPNGDMTIDEAGSLVRDVFGEAERQPLAGGGSIWLSGCLAREMQCAKAIAISDGQRFVLITAYMDTDYTEEQLRAIAAAAVEHLKELSQ